jgi:capsular exopolysaccharide synthesis family protein
MEPLLDRKHLLDYWAVLRRRRWVVCLAVAAVTLATLVGSFLVTPLYRAGATLQIERENPDILTFRELASVDYSWSAYGDFYQTQYRILSSEAVARRVVERLDLTSHPLFAAGTGSPGFLSRIRSLVPGAAAPAETDPVEMAAKSLLGSLEINPVRNSHLVEVAWVSPDPELAARIANGVADAYIQFNLASTYETSDQATEFLVNQIGALKREIAALEVQLQDYGEAKGIVSIDDSSNITLRALSDVAAKRTEARALLAQREAAYQAVSTSAPEALPDVLHSDLIARLKQEYASYEAQYSEKSRLFKDDWPEMQTLRSKLDQAKERLDLEIRSIANQVVLSAEAEYRRSVAEVRNLDALVSQQETAAQRLKRDAVEFASLQSEVQKKRETLHALLARQNQMALSTRLKDLDAISGNIRVVDPARTPAGPFRPDKRLNLLLGLVAGLGLGVAMAFFLDYLDNTITSPGDVERIVRLPTLAVVPRHGAAPARAGRPRIREVPATSESFDLVSHLDRRAMASEAFRELRTALLLSSAGRPPRQIMVTSALPEEGKSATAVNLAIVLAQMGKRVLLVDADLRKPRLHRVFRVENARGLSTCLSGLEPSPRSLVAATEIEGLDVLASGPIPPNPSELLNSQLFSDMAARFLEARYDHVVFDSPPVLSVADAIVLASAVDATLLVVRAGRTPRESLRLAVAKLARGGTRLVGVVLNDLDPERSRYDQYRYYGHEAGGEESRRDDSARGRVSGGGHPA